MTASYSGAVAKVIAADAVASTAPIDWDEAGRLFAAERSYWVATTSDDGRPHVRPVLADVDHIEVSDQLNHRPR